MRGVKLRQQAMHKFSYDYFVARAHEKSTLKQAYFHSFCRITRVNSLKLVATILFSDDFVISSMAESYRDRFRYSSSNLPFL